GSFSHVCYYTAGGGPGALPVSAVDVQLCTHIIMGFVAIDPAGNLNLTNVGGYQGLQEFSELRTRPRLSGVKLMLSVGGGQHVDAQIPHRFLDSAVGVLRDAQLDGLDLDWEFPSLFDRKPFSAFLEKIFNAFRASSYGPFLLSVAVPAPGTLVIAYDITAIARNVDFVNLMTYDLHLYKWYTPLTGFNSPLFSRSDELGYFATLNVQSSTEMWTSLGMHKSKLMVGIPTYGRSWILLSAQSAGVGSLAVGHGKEGDGSLSYPK
ncbi:unnamed protein product, partial [Ixodes hexagonus]